MKSHEDYVSFSQAKDLKELGFDWYCATYWDDEGYPGKSDWVIKHATIYCPSFPTYDDCELLRPTLYQVQKWLREVKNIHIEIKFTSNPQYEPWVGKVVIIENYPEPNTIINTDTCDTYEEALSSGIDIVLENLKEKQK